MEMYLMFDEICITLFCRNKCRLCRASAVSFLFMGGLLLSVGSLWASYTLAVRVDLPLAAVVRGLWGSSWFGLWLLLVGPGLVLVGLVHALGQWLFTSLTYLIYLCPKILKVWSRSAIREATFPRDNNLVLCHLWWRDIMLKDKEESSLFCEWLQINFDKIKNLKSQFGTNYLVSSNILRMKLHAMYYNRYSVFYFQYLNALLWFTVSWEWISNFNNNNCVLTFTRS